MSSKQPLKARELTTEEAIKKIFPKKVREEVGKAALNSRGRNIKQKSK